MYHISLDQVSFIGQGLHRPECVLTTKQGDLFVTDSRGGISVLRADGTQDFMKATGVPDGFLPNGIALTPERHFLIANLAAEGGVWRMDQSGEATLLLDRIDGEIMPPVNFVGLDRSGRTWITYSTRLQPREGAMTKCWADGFIAVMDEKGARIVADNIGYTNEAIVDPTGQWLYVNETVAQRTIRFPIGANAQLGDREVVAAYPPATFPDGFTFDSEGGVWCVSVASNRVFHVSKDGKQTIVLEDNDPARMKEVADAFDSGTFERQHIDAGKERSLNNIASIAFGGDDLKTVYMGSLFGDGIATFRAPVAGAPPVQWEF